MLGKGLHIDFYEVDPGYVAIGTWRLLQAQLVPNAPLHITDGHVISVDLSAYALTSARSPYALTSSLSPYALTSSLGSYAWKCTATAPLPLSAGNALSLDLSNDQRNLSVAGMLALSASNARR